MGVVTIGVDIGQRVDPTAIAVIELERRPRPEGDRDDVHHVARHLERLPIGTPYPQVVERVVAIAAAVVGRSAGSYPRLFLDATGVGTPILDLLREAGTSAQLIAVYFTYGDRRNVDDEQQRISLGKAWLVSRMQALLQSG